MRCIHCQLPFLRSVLKEAYQHRRRKRLQLADADQINAVSRHPPPTFSRIARTVQATFDGRQSIEQSGQVSGRGRCLVNLRPPPPGNQSCFGQTLVLPSEKLVQTSPTTGRGGGGGSERRRSGRSTHLHPPQTNDKRMHPVDAGSRGKHPRQSRRNPQRQKRQDTHEPLLAFRAPFDREKWPLTHPLPNPVPRRTLSSGH